MRVLTTRGIVIHGVILSSVSNSVRGVARERYRNRTTGTGTGTGAAVHLDMSRRVPSCQVSLIALHVCAACDIMGAMCCTGTDFYLPF